MRNCEIPGVVNNSEFTSDEEAAKQNQYCNLTTWLKENDLELRQMLEEVDTKLFKLGKEDRLLQDNINNNG